MISPVSKNKLRKLIKSHGLQTCIFDSSLLSFDWDGLEYQFRIFDGQLFLYRVIVQGDAILGNFRNYANHIY